MIHLLMKNSPDFAADKGLPVMRFIAPNDLSNMKLGRTKCSYMRTAVAAWFVDKQKIDINESSYSILFDETENQAHKKELQIKIKYYSETHQRPIHIHGTTNFIGRADRATIFNCIKKLVESKQLKLSRFVTLGMDGPNFNKAIKRLVYDWINNETGFEILDLQLCNDHILHNSFKYGCKELGMRNPGQ